MLLIIDDKEIQFREDGFINATQLCRVGRKKFGNWFQLESTKDLIKTLKNELNSNTHECASIVVDIKKGGNSKTQGSWIHPDLSIHLALWISPNFAIKVSSWVNEWRKYSEINENKFKEAIKNLEPCRSVQREKEIQKQLQEELRATIEVETPVGFIDLMTADRIIEIKKASRWKHALDQIISYGIFVDKPKYIYLFGECDNKDNILKVCDKYEVGVVFIDYYL